MHLGVYVRNKKRLRIRVRRETERESVCVCLMGVLLLKLETVSHGYTQNIFSSELEGADNLI